MMELRALTGPEALTYWPLLARGIKEWGETSDAFVDGKRVQIGQLVRQGLGSGTLELLLAEDAEDAVVYDVVSTTPANWLQGHQVWVRPELRGRGLLAAYFDAALRLVAERGLAGFFFVSTLPWWREKAPRLGFRVGWTLEQDRGPRVVAYFREAVI